VWLKLALWFWRGRFLNDPTPFLHFFDYLPFEEDLALHLNKPEFPLPKDNLYQVWFNLAYWFWRRRFLNDPIPLLHFFDYLPFEEDLVLYLNKLEFPLPKEFVPSLIEFGLLVLKKKIFENFQCFFTLSLLSPLGQGLSSSFVQT
jgi:hypothetical protein